MPASTATKITTEHSDFEQGQVVEIQGEFALVELEAGEACQCCAARSFCHTTPEGKRLIKIKNTLNAQVDDNVIIQQSDINQLKLAGMHYGLPLIGFMIAVIVGHKLLPASLYGVPKEILLFAIGLVAILGIGYLASLWNAKKVKSDFTVFRIVRIL